jgi:hypothetical protein
MKLQLKFKNIIDTPMCVIRVNDQELYRGTVPDQYSKEFNFYDIDAILMIEHIDKNPQDTIVKDGIIIRDRSFELDQIIIDGYDLEELKWASEFRAQDGAVYTSCLFFGPNGKFVLKFSNPVLHWILKTRHEKNNNDPHWEEDYNYYQQACKILQQILPR